LCVYIQSRRHPRSPLFPYTTLFRSDIIAEIEGRIDGLREDSEKAKEYLGLRDRFRELEINITLRNIEKLEKADNEAREDIDRTRSEEHTSELQSRFDLVCRLLLEKK